MPKPLIQEYWIIEFWHNSSLDSLRNFSMNWSSYLWVWGMRHRKFLGGLFFVCLFVLLVWLIFTEVTLQFNKCSVAANGLLVQSFHPKHHFLSPLSCLSYYLVPSGFLFCFVFLCHDLNKQNEDIFLVPLMKHFLLPLVSHLKPLPAPIPHLPILLTCF